MGTGKVLTRRGGNGAASARSLLLTVLGEFVLPFGEPVWTSTFLHVLGGLGVEEKSSRQAITRTAADGWIVSRREGRRVRWELTPAGRRMLTEGAERIYSFGVGGRPWDGRWLVVMTSVPESQRRLRHQLHTRLAWAGFGNPTAGMWVSPHPDREAEVKQIMADLGIGSTAFSFVGPFAAIGSEAELVARAWNLDEVAERYAAFLDRFSGMRPQPGDPMLQAQVWLVHEWRRFPLLDPMLPDALLPPGWIGRQARRLFDDKHAAWKEGAERRWRELAAG
ncbi:PaaX family transcriptional regulator C-terminal domain-containing protein [Thermomonospora catenispora]|uniref:PaaX family transcriptional regulator n=1 Tax=Thermomonospora catenispora TaxID=2493090 RepID=UPI001121BDB5|nr:PaaX family transcriptional regulator C-terminal domain-containing protein [Thermomonospora catenispora]TNY38290.1 PaaX family transcriptional regulator [Thermomonospora catenispora]